MHSNSGIEQKKMKNTFFGIALLVGVTAVSCKKESASEAASPATPATMHVEYRVQDASGKVNVSYLAPSGNAVLEEVDEQVSRSYYSVEFDIEAGHHLSVEASNVAPSHSTVQVGIYINGELKVQDISNDPSHKAIAQGNF